MIEHVSTPLQAQTLVDTCGAALKDCLVLKNLNSDPNALHYLFSVYDKTVGDAIKADMHMAESVAEAETTRWILDIKQATGEKQQLSYEPKFPCDFLFSLRCIADRPSGIRESRQMWLPLNTQHQSGPIVHRKLSKFDVDFSDAGRREFGRAISSGYASREARAYIDKIQREDPKYAVFVASIISSTCGITEEVEPDGPPKVHEAPHELAHFGHEQARADVVAELSRIVGSIGLEAQLATAPR